LIDRLPRLPSRYIADNDRHTRWAIYIVKDFIPERSRRSDLQYMRSNFDIAKQAMLLPDDVESRDYRRPFLVDLGATIYS
jgi:hypothetical protein